MFLLVLESRFHFIKFPIYLNLFKSILFIFLNLYSEIISTDGAREKRAACEIIVYTVFIENFKYSPIFISKFGGGFIKISPPC